MVVQHTQPLSSGIDSNNVNTVGHDAAVLHNGDRQYASIELEQSDQPDEEPDDIFGAEEVEDNVSQTSGGTETPESQQQGTKPKDHVAVLLMTTESILSVAYQPHKETPFF